MTNLSLPAVIRLLHAAQIIEARVSGEFSSVHGLSVKEIFLLMQLQHAPLQRLPRVELAKRLNTSASTVTRMTGPLEKLGFVTRESDPRDARLAFVVLSEAGALRAQEAQVTLEKHANYVFRDRCDEDEIAQLAKLLGRITTGAAGDLT